MKKNTKIKWFLIIFTTVILALVVLAIGISFYASNIPQASSGEQAPVDFSKWQSAVLYSHNVISIAQDLIILWPSYLLFAYYKKKISRKFLIISLIIQLAVVLSLNIFSSKPGVSAITISFISNYPFIKGYALALAGYMIIKIRE